MEWGLFGGFLAWCAALCWFDVRQRRLPNVLTLPGAAVALLACCLFAADGDWSAPGGAAVWTAINALGFLGRGMGAGDVKLAPTLGAAVGWSCGAAAVLPAVLGAQVITLAWAAVARDRTVPHGPAMCLAAVLVATLG
ncbi:A24 family peptidase [Tsukamurella sp. 1534]|uniref:prepilin peptidase n=1 Tax=Tsukamurella sp. 1534 TaxID=1151061 RepID=UPI000317F4F4|nr:A24 family peptidase [Tsukamurella sp. 1534]